MYRCEVENQHMEALVYQSVNCESWWEETSLIFDDDYSVDWATVWMIRIIKIEAWIGYYHEWKKQSSERLRLFEMPWTLLGKPLSWFFNDHCPHHCRLHEVNQRRGLKELPNPVTQLSWRINYHHFHCAHDHSFYLNGYSMPQGSAIRDSLHQKLNVKKNKKQH